MHLTSEDIDLLEGRRGPVLAKAMEIQCRLGEVFGAERMLPVRSVHMPGSSIVVSGRAGLGFVGDMMRGGGTFCVPTTLNPAGCDLRDGQQDGFADDLVLLQRELTEVYEAMGAVACHTCTPYTIGFTPTFGEHVAWGESSAIAYVNSVVGARTNREGGPSALAAALTGRTPAYGCHLDENRRPTLVVDVDAELRSTDGLGTLGYLVGGRTEDGVPLFTGIERPTNEQLKMLAAALASSGSVALFHIPGVTPDTSAEVQRGARQLERMRVSRDDLAATAARLDSATREGVGLVVLGCPHLSLNELESVAEALSGKQVSADVRLWLLVPRRLLGDEAAAGYARTIAGAGGRLVTDTCPVLGAVEPLTKSLHSPVMATNSAKLAHYTPGKLGLEVHYGSMERCLRAAVSGSWE